MIAALVVAVGVVSGTSVAIGMSDEGEINVRQTMQTRVAEIKADPNAASSTVAAAEVPAIPNGGRRVRLQGAGNKATEQQRLAGVEAPPPPEPEETATSTQIAGAATSTEPTSDDESQEEVTESSSEEAVEESTEEASSTEAVEEGTAEPESETETVIEESPTEESEPEAASAPTGRGL